MRRTILIIVALALISGLDAACDAGFDHRHWMRTTHLFGADLWHIAKECKFLSPLFLVLWLEFPLYVRRARGDFWLRKWRPDRIWIWCVAMGAGWLAWWAFARIGGAPWLE